MKSHIVSIHEEKASKCIVCAADFTSKQNLRRHYESVHEEKKSYKCDAFLLQNKVWECAMNQFMKEKRLTDAKRAMLAMQISQTWTDT